MSDLVEQILGKYRLEALLGVGGMGAVYRGAHVVIYRVDAVKVMHDHLAADPDFQARFIQEARAVAALHHPNIVTVHDAGEQDGRYYLAMELVTGGSLRDVLPRRGGARPPLALLVGMAHQAAVGLDYAHRKGIIHRDIKPENLLLAGPDDTDDTTVDRTIKISDFGLARLAEDSVRTATSVTMGSPAYMSPERFGTAPVDGRSDIYALGIILYEGAVGALPFKVTSLSDAVRKHIHEEPPLPRAHRPDLPQGLQEIILRCLQKDPAERYATAGDLARALAALRIELAENGGDGTISTEAVRTASARVRELDAPVPHASGIDVTVTLARSFQERPVPPSVPRRTGAALHPRVLVVDRQGTVA